MRTYSLLIDASHAPQHLERCLSALTRSIAGFSGHTETLVQLTTLDAPTQCLLTQRQVRFAVLPQHGQGALRHHGAAYLNGDVLVFLDAALEVPEQWLSGLARTFSHQAADAIVCARYPAAPLAPPLASWYLSRTQRGFDDHPWDWPTGQLAITREWYERLGGHDPRLEAGADLDILVRLWRCHAHLYWQDAPLLIDHAAPRRLGAWWHRQRRHQRHCLYTSSAVRHPRFLIPRVSAALVQGTSLPLALLLWLPLSPGIGMAGLAFSALPAGLMTWRDDTPVPRKTYRVHGYRWSLHALQLIATGAALMTFCRRGKPGLTG
ncbi:glycosyltransferase [Chromohalobacter sp. HP20-39]|uniref:glycosyltransferase n=1 Tax=Chromohalobacter sp. HP20-39 TaxID=3079306 RepID=UPI00294AE0DE|nr:glycosyltransferase [Chromohalobacter sp. HP20-39]MDV6318205.1 glycosyltransferase [Chromohalobacter sp. HP20-39]